MKSKRKQSTRWMLSRLRRLRSYKHDPTERQRKRMRELGAAILRAHTP